VQQRLQNSITNQLDLPIEIKNRPFSNGRNLAYRTSAVARWHIKRVGAWVWVQWIRRVHSRRPINLHTMWECWNFSLDISPSDMFLPGTSPARTISLPTYRTFPRSENLKACNNARPTTHGLDPIPIPNPKPNPNWPMTQGSHHNRPIRRGVLILFEN